MHAMRRIAVRMGEGWKTHADPAWLAGWTPADLTLEGGTTQVIDAGAGPPLVLLPPLPGFKESFVACLPHLARSFRVVTLDLRSDFGAAANPEARWAALVRDLEAVCEALGLGRVGVAGHSLGGALAQRWALAHPDRVAALVLSSSFARVTTPAGGRAARYLEQPLVVAAQRLFPRGLALAYATRLAATGGWVYDPRCDARVLDHVRHAIRASAPGIVAGRVALAFAHDTRARLGALRMPVHLVTGEIDTRFALESADEMAALIPGATRETSPGAGHLHPLSNPEWFADAITRWMRPRLG
jgi:pimeloyl-ACP methyl ester carboxylesterase